MHEVKINIQDAFKTDGFKQNMNDGSNCSESEPFALQAIDDSMEPEFDKECIIIIDPTGVVRNDSYVFAKDLGDEYIFRQIKFNNEGDTETYTLVPLNDQYESFDIPSLDYVEGVITQRAGKRRTYHKFYN